ncbi:MAG: DUF5060 domain-containing protein [Fimbriimonadaceae bacterium]|nr:DUF5060 domain-containing protein [Fimbriimonadaceae bacterium]
MIGLVAVMLVGAPTVGEPQLARRSVPCGECLEVRLPLTAQYGNPFDRRQVEVGGEFRGPGGETRRVGGFYYQAAQRSSDNAGRESVELVSEGCWLLRFAAPRPGTWQVRGQVRDSTGEVWSIPAAFEATPATGHGVIRRAAGTRYFEYADGTPFYPIGHNIAWAHQGGVADFERWLAPLPAVGVNLARIWLQWDRTLSIEYHGPRSGAGRYDLANAWRVDQVLATCRRLGVKVFFTLDSPEPYQREHYWLGKLTARPWTDFCAHNAANGGPLAEPREFYTTAAGRELIRQRLA